VKRSFKQFERRPQDVYLSPYSVMPALLPHITGKITRYSEPCSALKTEKRLIDHLARHGFECVHESDIRTGVDALDLGPLPAPIITNTPHERRLMHALIEHFMDIADFAWLLIDHNWSATLQAVPFIPHCSDIVAIGRVRWIEGSRDVSKDDYCWYRFCASHTTGPILHARIKTERAR
jgi:hypothetical protein